jgi:hypothetical protein
MKIRSNIIIFSILAQSTLIFVPPAIAQQSSERPAVGGEKNPSLARETIAWSQDRLAELDAAIAVLEKDAAKRNGEARAKAEAVLKELHGKRDAYRLQSEQAAANAKAWTDAQAAGAHKSLDKSWNESQAEVAKYLDSTKADLATRREVLDAELKVRQDSWRKSINELRDDAGKLNDQERAAAEARIDKLNAQIDELNTKMGRLQGASRESWNAVSKNYAQAQQLFSNTYASIRKSIENATNEGATNDGKKQ